MKAVIMAGGKGTRLVALTNDQIPKPMAMMNGKPILEWQVQQFRENGITSIMLVIGHLGEIIEDYFDDGSAFGVQIAYYKESEPLGSAGALAYLGDWLDNEPFFLSFGDLLFDIDISRMERFHVQKDALITILAHPNDHPYDSDLVETDASGRVTGFLKKSEPRDTWYDNCVNAGLYIIDPVICQSIPVGVKADLAHDVVFPAVEKNQKVYAYCTSEYVKDVGTPERLKEAETALSSGFVRSRNLKHKQRAIFLDRDGTINKYKGLVFKPEDIELETGVADAIELINRSGYLAIVITNQPSVARGLCEISDIEECHRKIKTLLGQQGAFMDAIYYCPHHPDKGYPEENPAYKVPCSCRKPQTGMIEAACSDFNIDPAMSWMIGDTTVDIETGQRAGVKTVLLDTGLAGTDKKYSTSPDMRCPALLDAVNKILGGQENGFQS